MSLNRSLIAPTSNPLLEQALRDKLKRRSQTTGELGELEPLAVRLGLIQNTLKPRLRAPKIAHGTRNARVTAARSLDHGHAAIRAGMEIGDALPGNVVACAGIGVGSVESSALVLSRLSGTHVPDLVYSGADMPDEE